MRRHELELIAALAEGTLEDETQARALIESSPAHRAEYEAQRAAIEAMRSLPRAELTDHERAALRRDVWTILQTKPMAQAKAPWYYRWSFVAAGVMVLAVGLTTLLNRGSDDAETAAVDMAAEEIATDGADTPTATAAAGGATNSGDATEQDSADDPLVALFRQSADRTRSGALAAEAPLTEDSDARSFADEHAACVVQAGLDDYEAIGEVTVEQAREFGLQSANPYLIAVPSGVELSRNTPIAFIDLETCAVVHTEG